MQDVIVENNNHPTPIKRGRGSKVSSFGGYMFSWVFKGLLLALLFGINFLLFADSGNQTIFNPQTFLQPEVMAIFIAISVFSFFLMLFVSFSTFLQNFLVAGLTMVCAWGYLHQFTMSDSTSILVPMLTPYLGVDVASYFTSISHWVIVGLAGLLMFVILASSSKKGIAYFTLSFGVVFMGIGIDSYLIKDHEEFYTSFDSHLNQPSAKSKKYVYLFLPNASSYVALGDLKDQLRSTKGAEMVQERLIAFLAKNEFTVYPNAYVSNEDSLNNFVALLNNMTDAETYTHIQQNVAISGLWKFKNLPDEDIYLKNAQILDVYHNSNYLVTAFQSRGVNFCAKNNKKNVSKCIEKNNKPFAVSDLNISLVDKTKILFLQWLNSFKFANDWSAVYSMLNGVINAEDLPIIGWSYDGFYVVNSFHTLDRLLDEIKQDQGNHAYFVFMDLPSDMFIYDEFCRLKPQNQWVQLDNYRWVRNKKLFEKRTAYLDQYSCLIGALERFMQKLKQDDLAKNMVISIQGLSGINDIDNSDDFVEKFKHRNMVLLAIRDPKNTKFDINNQICAERELVRNYLYKKGNCQEFNGMDLHPVAKKNLQKDLSLLLTKETIERSLKNFDTWYSQWEKFYSLSAVAQSKGAKLLKPLENQLHTNDVEAEKVIDEVKVMDKPLSEGEEVKVMSLGEKVRQENEAQDNALQENAMPEEEQAISQEDLHIEHPNGQDELVSGQDMGEDYTDEAAGLLPPADETVNSGAEANK